MTPPHASTRETRWPAALGRRGAVASPHPLATLAGIRALLRGGNAADAAIAAGVTLAVVYPHMTGLGGDSFWLCWDAQRQKLHGLAACGSAASLAAPALYLNRGLSEIPARGPLAALTVPGAVDGLWEAHRWSRSALDSPLGWADLLADAVQHATDGIPVSAGQARITARATDLLARAGEPAFRPFAATYLRRGLAPEPGTLLIQTKLARTLNRLAEEGGRAFYEGEIGSQIASACEAAGSPLRAVDLAAHRSRWVEPLTVAYRDGIAASVPPPSQGLAVLEILGMLNAMGMATLTPDSADHIHLLVEATKLAFGDRDRWLADPEVVPVPIERLLDRDYLETRAKRIRMDTAALAPPDSGIDWSAGETIACVTADALGNCVVLIQSLYHEWGSGLIAGESGVVLQNRGAFFTLDPTHPNVLAPGKRPSHTLTPFMYLRSGRPVLAVGTMGGEGQPQTLAAIATRILDLELDVQEAIEAPRWRYGRTWGAMTHTLSLEDRVDASVVDRLRTRGHDVQVVEPWSDRMGHAQAIWLDHDAGLLIGGGDPRADSPALGA